LLYGGGFVCSGVSLNLGEALRLQTRPLHVQVERSGVMQALLRGRVDRSTYCALLRNLHAIYGALEDGLDHHAERPNVACVRIAGLARSEPLAQDLLALHGIGWESAYPVLPATGRYVRRLREIDLSAPDLLPAHAYVRYLGDLSGGQVLRRIVAKALALGDPAGTRFYAFGEPDCAPELALRFRAGLDAIDADATAIAELVAEAQWGFALHGDLFEQLAQPGAPGA
jgi:heme oxygenase